MEKIGLILANPITNYGAHLQAYATQYIIESLGFETEIIDYTNIKSYTHYYYGKELLYAILQKVKKIVIPNRNIVEGNEAFLNNKRERIQKTKEFREKRLHNIRCYKKYIELVKDTEKFKAVIIGSDQMWLPGTSLGPYHSLRFVPNGIRRVSYATSLGVSSYPRYCWKSARDMWTHMDFVSVREEQGANIIREICGESFPVKVVADPTYLLTKEQWSKAIPQEKMIENKYVFCYFLGEDIEAKKCARRYADIHNYLLVSILSCESYTDIDSTFADKTIGAASPEEFINWIRGAECVFTDSFHGLAFSVINHVQFYVFYRVRKDSKQSRNSRIDNILKMWSCEDRLIKDANINWVYSEEKRIDYIKVENLVAQKRGESLDYLKKAIGVDEN